MKSDDIIDENWRAPMNTDDAIDANLLKPLKLLKQVQTH